MEQDYEDKYHIIETQNWWFLSRRARICDMLSDEPRNAAILDVGCSSGQLMKDLQALGFTNLTGIDVSSVGVERAKKEGFHCLVMDGQEPDFEPNSFDLVIASDSLEHMEHDLKALSNWNKLLKPGGKAIIFVPAFMSLWSGHDVINQHYRRYTVGELKRKASESNFKVIQNGYWNFTLFFPIYVWRKIKNLFANKEGIPKDDFQNNGTLINRILRSIMSIENKLANFVRFPVGVSAFLVVKKDGK